jgi:23S rRNA (uracil1939-C5)-methyltransferase
MDKISNLECVRLSSDGSGIGYISGRVVFVPGLLPGEIGEVEVYEVKKKWLKARLLKIMKASPQRQEGPCTVFPECGGCRLQHTTYEETLLWKRRWVQDALQRIGKVQAEVKPVLGMSFPWRYRNKARLHRSAGAEWGYYREKSNIPVSFSDCLLLSERMNSWIKLAKKLLAKGYPEIHTITLRENTRGEGLLLLEGVPTKAAALIQSPELAALAGEGLRSVWAAGSENSPELLWGDDIFTQTIQDISFNLSPDSFLQVNSWQMEVLYGQVLAWAGLSGHEIVWDLYSGIGTLALLLALRAGKVTGIEENPAAVRDALQNAAANSSLLANCQVEFLQGKVEWQIRKLPEKPDVVVLDPPRAGLHTQVGQSLLEIKPRRLIYVSCEPGTLARDLGLLTRNGYSIAGVQPIDMFPWTAHVETVVLLNRKHS